NQQGANAAATNTNLADGPWRTSGATLNQRKINTAISRNQRSHQCPCALPENRPFHSSCSGSSEGGTPAAVAGTPSGGAAPGWSDAPHLLQNALPSGRSALHLGQDIFSSHA